MTMLQVEEVRMDALRLHPRNPRRGDVSPIAESLATNGQYRPLVVAKDGTIIAGNHTYQAAQRLDWTTIQVTRLPIDSDSPDARRIMLADNRTSDLGTYDDGLLLSLLDDLDDPSLGTGYDEDSIDHLRHMLDAFDDHDALTDENRHKPPKRRDLPVRSSISLAGGYRDHIAAIRILGFEFGLLSTSVDRFFVLQTEVPAYMQDMRIAFMDNPWHDYDHAHHTAAVERVKPIAATTRDVMTKQQCKDAGIEHYTIDQTVAFAQDLAPHVDEIILIPKYDCINDLPTEIDGAKVVLGYSVPSSYGATPVNPEAFKGRPVHLLGGSWPKQRALLHVFGEDCVSLDHNYMLLMSKYGAFWQPPNHVVRKVQDLGFPNVHQRGLNHVAMMLSLLAISTDLHEWNGDGTGDGFDDADESLDPAPARPDVETFEPDTLDPS